MGSKYQFACGVRCNLVLIFILTSILLVGMGTIIFILADDLFESYFLFFIFINLVLMYLLRRVFNSQMATRFVESSPDAILGVASDGRIVISNTQASLLFGYSKKIMANMQIEELLPTAMREQHQQLRQQFFKNPQARTMAAGRELTALNSCGKEIPVEINLNTITQSLERVVIVTIRDSSERHKQVQTQQRLLNILDNAVDFIGSIDHKGNWLYINQAGRRMLGLSEKSQLDSLRLTDVYTDDTVKAILASGMLNRQKSGDLKPICNRQGLPSWKMDGKLLLYNGTLLPISQSWFPNCDPLGEIICLSTIAQDISKRKKIEEALRTSEERFRAAFDAGVHGVALIDAQGQFLKVNPAMETITGYPSHRLLQQRFQNLLHLDNAAENLRGLERLLSGKTRTYYLEKRAIHQQGHELWIRAGIAGVYDKQGSVLYFVIQMQDVSKQKQTEQALLDAKKIAETASHAKSVFLANMSHELRTPLNGILGFAQLLRRDTGLSATQQDQVQSIYRSGEHLLHFITEILDLSKMEAGRFELQMTDCDLPSCIDEIIDLFKMRAQRKGLSFEYQNRSPLPRVIEIDAKRFRQILTNLLDNALKFTESGRIALFTDYQHSNLLLEIQDTGIGIQADALEQIFLPFQQTGNEHYRAQGTGLGLSITHKLINMMGGKLEVNSQPEQGTQFLVHFPIKVLADVQQPVSQTQQLDPVQTDSYSNTGQPYKILSSETAQALPSISQDAEDETLENLDSAQLAHILHLSKQGDIEALSHYLQQIMQELDNIPKLLYEFVALTEGFDIKAVRDLAKRLKSD
ncbi:PAS domain-containing sensor histidine kinase [Candidatus Venteria ishoeyi]|uniref:histidine kinase n=1 Tax=Candidatus Venteria ishoeyi TaxID=1899563 RepID=A0A1H6FEK8_9GAMM|nr:PAS domain S-box protein [Candidatus Venteria ishoeyi]MDM8546456.1 PAS domain S-box protein [Candidatus Venteria ishoeyi]SEH08093.1 Cell-division control histidine kinase PdhS [Candidatus Venteria ishoeyi]